MRSCIGCNLLSSRQCGKIVLNKENGAVNYSKEPDKRCRDVEERIQMDERERLSND